MKLNKFGINIDEGLPLKGKSIEKLYEDCFIEQSDTIKEWITDKKVLNPLLIGGQIGSGKTTLLNKIFQQQDYVPSIVLEFDRESLNLDEGDFISIVFTGFLSKAIELNLNLEDLQIPYSLFKLKENKPEELLQILSPSSFSIETFEAKNNARMIISKNSDYFKSLIGKVGEQIQRKNIRNFFILASGIDKFNTKSAAYFALKDVIENLSKFKTLFEVNAVHLFISQETSPFKNNPEKLFITSVFEEKIKSILKKRMGAYHQSVTDELSLISKWSGGNPRQAIRILSHYLSYRKNANLTKAEKLAKAIKKTTDDFFAFAQKPSIELIRSVEREKKIESSLIQLPGDKETAQEALYGNWILISNNSDNGSWPAIVNPLIKPFFTETSEVFESPEQALLKKYAESHGISASGLTFNVIDDNGKEKSPAQLLFEYFSSGIEEPFPLKITEILDLIAAALLSNDRKDRIIIAYKNENVLEAARSYIFAKANSYEYQRYEHKIIRGGKNHNPIRQIKVFMLIDTDILSFDFKGDWSDKQLGILNKQRDIFIDHQMIWWIPYEKVKKYLPHWVQLRELFEFYVLEDEMLGSLSKEEIESDISFFKDLVVSEEGSEYEMVKNLKKVLKFLQRGGENG